MCCRVLCVCVCVRVWVRAFVFLSLLRSRRRLGLVGLLNLDEVLILRCTASRSSAATAAHSCTQKVQLLSFSLRPLDFSSVSPGLSSVTRR